MQAGAAIFKLGFQISPIVLVRGLAGIIPGQMLPIVALTQSISFTEGLLSGGDDIDENSFFANFSVVPGGTLVSTRYAEYPFANQQVAANAGIVQPLRISLLMDTPVNSHSGYGTKLATMTLLQQALQYHILLGGMFTVATPASIYPNCLLLELKDVSTNPKQPQSRWQWDFEQPLLTEAAALTAYSSSMDRINNAVPSIGSLSGGGATTSPLSLAAPTPAGLPAGSVATSGGLTQFTAAV